MPEKKDFFGLGYQPSSFVQAGWIPLKGQQVPPISEVFISADVGKEGQVLSTDVEGDDEDVS